MLSDITVIFFSYKINTLDYSHTRENYVCASLEGGDKRMRKKMFSLKPPGLLNGINISHLENKLASYLEKKKLEMSVFTDTF